MTRRGEVTGEPQGLRAAGWSTLFVGIAIPFWMSGTFVGLWWTPHCIAAAVIAALIGRARPAENAR